jgi:outer membrane receptor for ferrienterochelin and colicin
MACNPPYGTKVFTNIDKAFMTGFEAGAEVKFLNNFTYSLSAAYTYAQNSTLNEPLPEIPPFTVNSFIAFENKKVQTRIHGRFAADQNREEVSISGFGSRYKGLTCYNCEILAMLIEGCHPSEGWHPYSPQRYYIRF